MVRKGHNYCLGWIDRPYDGNGVIKIQMLVDWEHECEDFEIEEMGFNDWLIENGHVRKCEDEQVQLFEIETFWIYGHKYNRLFDYISRFHMDKVNAVVSKKISEIDNETIIGRSGQTKLFEVDKIKKHK